MNLTATLDEIKKLDVSDRLWLAHAIWDSIDEADVPAGLSDELKEELDRRMVETREHPEKLLTLEQLMARVDGTP